MRNEYRAVIRQVIICAAVFMLFSCMADEKSQDLSGSDMSEIRFELNDMPGFTRSSLNTSETIVDDVLIMAYHDGCLAASGYWTNGVDMSLTLNPDYAYNLYALANVGNVMPPGFESDLQELSCKVDGIAGLQDSFPMSWSRTGYVAGRGDTVAVGLERLVAKVVLSVDCGDTGLEVTEVSLAQTPLSVCPFAEEGSRAVVGEVAAGDSASASDLALLNSGGTAHFYMLENMQGILLADNADPMQKVPSKLQETSGVCTYLEVGCVFVAESSREGSAVYRMYLGEDNVSDFNVRRNRILAVFLSLTADGLTVKDSWKIVPDYVQHVTGLTLDNDNLDVLIGDKVVLTASVAPYDAADKGIVWTSSDTSVAVVDSYGTVTAKSEGNCIIKAVSADDSACYDECLVTVSDAVSSLSFDRSEVKAVLGADGGTRISEFSVKAVYLSGKTATVTDACGYASDSASASVGVPGIVTHKTAGSAVITASYEGKTAMLNVVTEAFTIAGVEFECEQYAVSLGETLIVRYRVLYNDGTATNFMGYQLANFAAGSCNYVEVEDETIANVDTYGRLTADKAGTTTISVSVWCSTDQVNHEASVQLTVNEAYLVSVYATAPPMFYNGSGGPGLYGVYSDKTERNLTASSSWQTSDDAVTYTASGGIAVSGQHDLKAGTSVVTFTGTYKGMSASVTSIFGKWIREARFAKTLARTGVYNYRMMVIYDDFTEEYVPFDYQTSTDMVNWSSSKSATVSGVDIVSAVPETVLRGATAEGYYDHNGNLLTWYVGY